MKIEKAVDILEKHNKWRRHDNSDLLVKNAPKMIEPIQLGIAIDTIVKFFKFQKI